MDSLPNHCGKDRVQCLEVLNMGFVEKDFIMLETGKTMQDAIIWLQLHRDTGSN